jgi:hypothetical protein
MAREKLESIQKQIQLNTGKGELLLKEKELLQMHCDMRRAEESFYKIKDRGRWLSIVQICQVQKQ